MTHAADPSHPRYSSLLRRSMLEDAMERGMLADSAMIAHGRGEAFDYLIGETTMPSALEATKEAANRLVSGQSPVISINGNAAAIAADNLIRCAAILSCPLEINIFYRTPERMRTLIEYMEERKLVVSGEREPDDWVMNIGRSWGDCVSSVRILGANPDARIPGLEGPRAKCHSEGILNADVILVPLEDGDRCEALVAMGKDVIVVDLNPMSRSATMASVTIVDELTRFSANLLTCVCQNNEEPRMDWNNADILQRALDEIVANIARDTG